MTPLPLRIAAKLLPRDAREEVLSELLDHHRTLAASHGSRAARAWAWRQPWAALSATMRWRRQPSNAGRPPMTTGLAADLASATRAIARRPGVALTVVLTIAIGVGALSAIVGVIDAVLLRPLPYPDAGRLVWLKTVSTKSAPSANPPGWANPSDVADWNARATSLQALAAFETFDSTALVANAAVRVKVASVHVTIGRVLGLRAASGRLFTAGDDAPGHQVMVISDAFWRERLGADPDIVGRSITLAGSPVEVVGVLGPAAFRFPSADTDFWLPLVAPAPGDGDDRRGGVWTHVIARVRADRSLADAQADLARVAQSLANDYPRTDKTRTILVQPYREGVVGSTREILVVLGWAVALVLVVACANVGHLLLVVAQGRRREFSVRTALGASSWRLARLMLAESVLLAAVGGLIGVAIAPSLLKAFLALYPDPLPSVGAVAMSGVAVASAVVGALVAALASVIPPWLIARSNDVNSSLKATDRGGEAPAQRRARTGLVIAQVALSTALLVSGGLLLRTFMAMADTKIGFDPEHLLSFNVALPDSGYPTLDQEARFYDTLNARLRAIPGVVNAGASTLLPFSDGDFNDGFVRVGTADQYPNLPIGRLQNVTPGFLETLGLNVRAGRTIQPTDTASAAPVAVVNQTLERKYFPDGALGHRIRFRNHIIEIVGVVSDKRHIDFREDVRADLYLPRAQSDNPRLFGWVLVRTAGDPRDLVKPMTDAVVAADPHVSVAGIETMTERVRDVLAPDRFRTVLVGTLAGVALLLAAVGLYGLVAYSVALEARHIAIRMALGATALHTASGVLTRVVGLVGVGTAAGFVLFLAGASRLETFLSGVSPHDPVTLVTVAATLAAVALAAAIGPARRAVRMDPISVLRTH